jgi:hypothetical protein
MNNPSPDIPVLEREQAVQATAWFSVLMHGASVKDLRSVIEARAELEQRGIVVTFKSREGARRG